MVIIQILKQQLKLHEAIKSLKKENKRQRKLISKLGDKLVHKEQLLFTFQKYTKKITQEYKINHNDLEIDLKKVCISCPCLFRSIESFVENNLKEFTMEENHLLEKIKK